MVSASCCRSILLRAATVLAAAMALCTPAIAQSHIGACCTTSGCIANAADTQCQSLGGLFYPGQTCSVCDQSGFCCINVTCATGFTQASCLANGGVWKGTTCTATQCGPTETGACCNPADGTCINTTTQANCPTSDKWIANTTCSTAPCEPFGACCDPAGGCAYVTKANCNSSGQTWYFNTPCAQAPCNSQGACCNPLTGSCTQTTTAGCPSGYNFTLNASCTSKPCESKGACCLNATCLPSTQSECLAKGGIFLGANSLCTSTATPCPGTTGACCIAAAAGVGNCISTTQANCPPGVLFLAGKTCNPNPCPPPESGACCLSSGCLVIPKTQCPPGVPYIPLTTCSATVCPPLGACCSPAAGCQQTTLSNCFGQWFANKPCSPDPCQQTGACCTPAGCTLTANTACNGLWFVNETCTPNPCKRGGCCNKATGQCSVVYRGLCEQAGLTYLGDGVICAASLCPPQLGSCCFPGTVACVMTTQSQCTGTWFANTTCQTHPCYKADINGSGAITTQDLFDFLQLWFCRCP